MTNRVVSLVKKPGYYLLFFLVVFSLFNSILQYLMGMLNLPLFMDTIFTMLAALLWGPLPGMLVGIFTNGLMELFHGLPGIYFPFALVNIYTGIMTGYWSRRGKTHRLIDMLMLLFLLVVGNSVLGTLIVVFLFSGLTGSSIDLLVKGLLLTGNTMTSAAFMGRLLINSADKTLGLALAWLLYSLIYPLKQEAMNG